MRCTGRELNILGPTVAASIHVMVTIMLAFRSSTMNSLACVHMLYWLLGDD